MGFLVWALVCSPCGFGSLLPLSGRFPRVLPEPWLEIQFWGLLGFRRGLSACAREFCALSLFRALPLVSRARFGAWVPVGGFPVPGVCVCSGRRGFPRFCFPGFLRLSFSRGSACRFLLWFLVLFLRGFCVSVSPEVWASQFLPRFPRFCLGVHPRVHEGGSYQSGFVPLPGSG